MLDRPGGRKTSRSQICLLGLGASHTRGLSYPSQGWDREQSGQPGLAGDRSPCPSLSGCVFCKTTFLLGLTRDPPHPPMGGSCHSLPWPRRLTPSPCVFSFRKPRQRPGCSSALPREPSQGLRGARARTCLPHIPWLVYLFCWPGPREPLTAGPGLGVAVVSGLHRQVTEPPTRNSR